MLFDIQTDNANGGINDFLKSFDFSPIYKMAEGILQHSIEKNFEQGGRISNETLTTGMGGGEKWKDLAPATIKQRQKKGYSPGMILQKTAQLRGSNYVRSDSEGVYAGSNLAYAAVHQFGGDIQINPREGSSKWTATKNQNGNYQFKFAKKNKKLTKRTIERKYRVGSILIHIPKRPYVAWQYEDTLELMNEIAMI
jgi:phage gpG-like protein